MGPEGQVLVPGVSEGPPPVAPVVLPDRPGLLGVGPPRTHQAAGGGAGGAGRVEGAEGAAGERHRPPSLVPGADVVVVAQVARQQALTGEDERELALSTRGSRP